MNKKLKIGLLIAMVLVLSSSMMAFRPFNGDDDDDGIPDQTETLAEALGIDVETLQAVQETAHQMALEQAVADGKITQEQADAMLEKESGSGKHHGIRGVDDDEFLAEALGITIEELETAQQEAKQMMVAQALENGEITQEEYDQYQLRQDLAPYFEQAHQAAFQNAIDQALADGVITNEQAESLLSGEFSFGKGPGDFGHGGHGPGGRMKPGGDFSPNSESSETE